MDIIQSTALLISGPTGVGKSTMCKELLSAPFFVKDKQYTLVSSPSATTRPKRDNESEGKEYLFVSKEEFDNHDKSGNLANYTYYGGYEYGLLTDKLNRELTSRDVFVSILTVDGSIEVSSIFRTALLVYVLPPSFEELTRRVKERDAEKFSKEKFETRLNDDFRNINLIRNFDFITVNTHTNETVQHILNQLYRKMYDVV